MFDAVMLSKILGLEPEFVLFKLLILLVAGLKLVIGIPVAEDIKLLELLTIEPPESKVRNSRLG